MKPFPRVLQSFAAQRNLRFEAGHAVRHGMPWAMAFRAITLPPGEVIGIAETHGSIEPGKAANLVIWSGDPFEPSSEPERIFIKGREIEGDSRQLRLLERYKELDGRRCSIWGSRRSRIPLPRRAVGIGSSGPTAPSPGMVTRA